MSPRSWRDRIRDILDAIEEIQKFTHDMDYEPSNSMANLFVQWK